MEMDRTCGDYDVVRRWGYMGNGGIWGMGVFMDGGRWGIGVFVDVG